MAQKMTKERLRQYVWLVLEIKNQEERYERVRAETVSPASPRLDGMPRSNFAANRLEDKVARMIELERLLKKNIKKAQKEAAEIERAIQTLALPRDRELMRLKYLEGLTWEEVSEKLDISRQWATSLHGRILKELP